MTTPPPDDQYARALALLRDAPARARVQSAIAALDAAESPAVAWIAGQERARTAGSLGVLAGSFNPPTLAHVALAAACQALDAVAWTISRVTVDKETVTRAPLADRLLTLAALTAERHGEAVALVNRGLYADQAAAMRGALPGAARLVMIVGFDKIVQMFDPRYYEDRNAALEELFSRAEVWVAPRGADGQPQLDDLLARPANRRWRDRVRYVPLDPRFAALAATDLRAAITAGRRLDDLAPPAAQALADSGAFTP